MDVWIGRQREIYISIFYVDDNRQKETLLPIKKNVYINALRVNNNIDIDDIELPNRLYSDSFQRYQISDFNRIGFILYRNNHSLWFAQGSFHTNTIEGVWNRIKRTNNKIWGINGAILSKLESKSIIINEYVNGIICSGLFFMECKHKKLGLNGKKNY